MAHKFCVIVVVACAVAEMVGSRTDERKENEMRYSKEEKNDANQHMK